MFQQMENFPSDFQAMSIQKVEKGKGWFINKLWSHLIIIHQVQIVINAELNVCSEQTKRSLSTRVQDKTSSVSAFD